jgi:Uma2 family endonuclease
VSMPAEAPGIMTAEQLEGVDIPGKWVELVRGQLIVSEPPSTYHGFVTSKLVVALYEFVRQARLGTVFGDAGFKLESNPDTVRAPDASFVSYDRLPSIPSAPGYAAVAPDLVVEVVSWNDRRGQLLAKVGSWLDAGARLVWVVDPIRKEAHVHRPDGSITILGFDDALDGEDVLPGFSYRLSDALPSEVDTPD